MNFYSGSLIFAILGILWYCDNGVFEIKRFRVIFFLLLGGKIGVLSARQGCGSLLSRFSWNHIRGQLLSACYDQLFASWIIVVANEHLREIWKKYRRQFKRSMQTFCKEVLEKNPEEVAGSAELTTTLRDTLNNHLRNAWGNDFKLKVLWRFSDIPHVYNWVFLRRQAYTLL